MAGVKMTEPIPNKEQFTLLLRQAIEKINQKTGLQFKKIRQELGDKVGRKVSTIEYWERTDNFTLPKRSELEGLAEAVYPQLFDRSWLDQFLMHGKHPDPDTFSEYLANKYEDSPPLPRADKLIGRAQHIEEIYKNLRNLKGDLIITIDGLGGIGKTAIASKIHDLFLGETIFDKVIWISADRSDIPIFLKDMIPFNFETILDGIGQSLGEQAIKKMSLRQKVTLVDNLLKTQRCLIILDNLETADIPQHEIITHLQPFLNPSRALLTSRRRFTGDGYQIHLQGLEQTQAFELMRYLGEEKSVTFIAHGDDHNLRKIHQVTGGSPLAIKLVIGLLRHVEFRKTIEFLEKAMPLDRVAGEDEYMKFYRHIFMKTWQLLTDEDEKLLIGLAQFDTAEGIRFELIENMPQLAPGQIAAGIQYLWRLSLIEVQEQSNSKELLYYLHPLTRYFVISDIVKRKDAV